MKDLAIYGAGGLGREVACLIRRINEREHSWNLIGFFDDEVEKGTAVSSTTVLGGLEELNDWCYPVSVVIAIGSPTDIFRLVDKIDNKNVTYPNIIDPDCLIFDKQSMSLGKGNVIMSKCNFSCQSVIGDFNVFNIGVGVGHDVVIGCYNVFMPNVNVSGGVVIGNLNMFGVKSSILQYLRVGNNTTIGAHCLMIRNAKSDSLYFGVPGERQSKLK